MALALLSYLFVSLSTPGSYFVGESYTLATLAVKLHGHLPFNAATWNLVILEQLFPPSLHPLLMLLVQAIFTVSFQVTLRLIVCRVIPEQERTPFSWAQIFSLCLAHVPPALYYSLGDSPLWLAWLSPLLTTVLAISATRVLLEKEELFGNFYFHKFDYFYELLRLLRLVLLPFLALVPQPEVRILTFLASSVSLLWLGLLRKTSL
jgi:hypothetical protein